MKMLRQFISLGTCNVSATGIRHGIRKEARIITHQRNVSGVPASAERPEDKPAVSQHGKFESLQQKPVTNKPFAKDLFLGKFDKTVLIYPEISDRGELAELNQMVQPIERFFTESLDSKSIDINAEISKDVMRHLGELGLFGQQIPQEYGGLGLNATKYARLAEITALDGSIAVTLAAHQAIGLKGLLIAGNEAQKQKYLPKLATGEHIAAFCLTEPSSGSDAASIQTRAVPSEDGKTFYLTGGKIWISNGGIADIFTVFAKVNITAKNDLKQVGVFFCRATTIEEGEKQDKVTAFIVERNFGGVSSGKPEDKLGIRGSNTCEVHFDNTPVPAENVLGEVGGGFKIAMNILNSGRFSMGSSGAGILKKLIGMTAEHAISRMQFGSKLCEFKLIKEKFAKMAVTTYAMESMAYLTAGIIDMYEKPDLSVEAAMVKIFSSEGCWMCVNECLQVLGGLGFMKNYPYERYLRDARILMIFEGTNEILRLYVSLAGLKYAGQELKELVGKLRDPLNNPRLVFLQVWNHISGKLRDKPKLTLRLNEEVHPSLKNQTDILEECTLQFQRMVEIILQRHGNKVVQEQLELKRLSDICIDLYAMTACIGRTSRAYCLGLRNADHELLLTKAFCHEAYARVQQNLTALREGKTKNNDDTYMAIAETVFQNKGYAAEHPLTVNW